jgi:hypothetical protein
MPFHDGDESDLDDAEYPDQEWEGNGDAALVPCPHCRREIYEEAERCPSCGFYITREEGGGGPPWWLALGVIACLVAALSWILGW